VPAKGASPAFEHFCLAKGRRKALGPRARAGIVTALRNQCVFKKRFQPEKQRDYWFMAIIWKTNVSLDF